MSRRRENHDWAKFDIDLNTFDRVNLYPLASGEMAIRPGFRKLFELPSTSKIITSKSIKHPYSQEVWHYIVDYSTVDGTVIRVLDECFQEVQTFDTGAGTEPLAASINAFSDQVLVTSPSFATVWGWMGDSLTTATPKDSVNELNTPAIPIPSGISTVWGSRLVVGSGAGLFISDPLEPRTFVGNNVLVGDWASEIFGLHVTDQGALIVVSDSGVYALPEDAAASQVVFGNWSKLTDFNALDYSDTAICRGELWGLTRRGLRRLVPSSEELRISEMRIPRRHVPRAHVDDYREATIVGGQDGPLLSVSNRLFVMDLSQQHSSWWVIPNEAGFQLRGTLLDSRGMELLVGERAVWRIMGNFDGDRPATAEEPELVVGGFAGVVPQPAGSQLKVRKVRFGADGVGDIRVTVRAETDSVTPLRNGVIIGTASWDVGAYEDSDIETTETSHSVRCQEISLELMSERPLTRVSRSGDVRGLALGRNSS